MNGPSQITALQRLDLLDDLESYMRAVPTSKGLDLLDINDKIDEVLVKLGYSANVDDTPPPNSEDTPTEVPKVVSDYLAGEFNQQTSADFSNTLISLAQYVDSFITFDQVKAQAVIWMNNLLSKQEGP